MLISIIIPTLNEALSIAKAVESAWNIETEALKVSEVIVVDAGSSDETRAIAKQLGATIVESQKGRGTQLAKGIAVSKGDWILMLHADCYLDPKVGKQLIEATEEIDVKHGAMRQSITQEGTKYRLLEWGNRKRIEWFSLPYGDQAIFIKREAYDDVGGIPDLPLMEDVELMTRLRKISKPRLIEGPVYISARRWEEKGVIAQTLKNWFLLIAYRMGVSAETLVRWYR